VAQSDKISLKKFTDPDPDPDYRQNLAVSSVARVPPFHYEFCENGPSNFCAILLTNKRANADENITFLAEVITFGPLSSVMPGSV